MERPFGEPGVAYIKKIRHPLYYESGFKAGDVPGRRFILPRRIWFRLLPGGGEGVVPGMGPHALSGKVRNGTTNELPGNFVTFTPADIADGALFLPFGSGYFEDNALVRQNIYWCRNGF